MKHNYEYLIIGAGIVGLATAYQLKKQSPKASICLLEKEKKEACHQTGNNSGVVHSGVYYKPGSHKARNCKEGRLELLTFCNEYGIPLKQLSKLIVATETCELAKLHEIFARGQANEVAEISLIGPQGIKDIEPYVNAIEAIHIPHCFVINYKQVAKRLVEILQREAVEIYFGEQVIDIRDHEVTTQHGSYLAKTIINCSGLFSDRIARLTSSNTQYEQQILPFRGEYYELKEDRRYLVNGLIYPVPDPKFPFLGVHLTRMIDGKVEAGPNAVLAYSREGYKKTDVNIRDLQEMLSYPGFWQMARRYWKIGIKELYRSFSKKAFLRDLQRLVPALQEQDLLPGGAGIRAQVVTKEGLMLDDFSFTREGRVLHVLNAPSPAATASFSIGRQIASLSRDVV
ncbi:MAG: L-2-hydroxyglutarate oxidase [Simkania sp.]|nr:L-2-hydroxyglutarate oxidase [Simkania sp.]